MPLIAAAVLATTAGCGVTVERLPLPSKGMFEATYPIHAIFANVLNLPDQAKVKVGGSDVGVVSHIDVDNYRAEVELDIRKDIELPRGTTAQLRQATPLGDVFIALAEPNAAPDGPKLRAGDTLPIEQTSAGATVEELLVSVSLLFNGGGIADIAQLTDELDAAVGGRADELSYLITKTTSTFTTLHDNSSRIDGALAGFDALTATIEANHAELGQVAETLPPLLGTIAENNRALGELLAKVATVSAALGDYADSSTEQLRGLLDNTRKLMSALAATGDTFGALQDAFHEIRPYVDATFRGSALAPYANIQYLDIGLLTAPGTSKFFDLTDMADFVGSLMQVLQIITARLTGPR
ncbi:MCE family protein [Nocardia arthritidis]|uniref:MCE family protein n=1 Tax=Nocardia arthritidis TaxID=228602 RepID=A0A6G9YE63_9NOCA|nr:MCE family protein [Nocardia arthritidis]QIS11367.1 MCE family protein [Nocardia arthritidis]